MRDEFKTIREGPDRIGELPQQEVDMQLRSPKASNVTGIVFPSIIIATLVLPKAGHKRYCAITIIANIVLRRVLFFGVVLAFALWAFLLRVLGRIPFPDSPLIPDNDWQGTVGFTPRRIAMSETRHLH